MLQILNQALQRFVILKNSHGDYPPKKKSLKKELVTFPVGRKDTSSLVVKNSVNKLSYKR